MERLFAGLKGLNQRRTLFGAEKRRIYAPQNFPHISQKRWGFIAEDNRNYADKIKWPNQDFLDSLLFGFSDNDGSAPSVSTAYPHQKPARNVPGEFLRCVHNELENGWLLPPLAYPP